MPSVGLNTSPENRLWATGHSPSFAPDAGKHRVGDRCLIVSRTTSALEREVVRIHRLANAVAIIACHNHPSGDPTPTVDDLDVTRRLAATGEVLGIELLDHLVGGRYYSFKEAGRL